MNKIVSLEYLNDYSNSNLKNAIEVGIERLNINGFFKPKMKVLLKVCLPNAASQDSAECTNPAVVRAVVDYLNKLGISCVVADCPSKKHSLTYLNQVYLNTGMLEMSNIANCELNRNLATSNIEILDGLKTKSITTLDIINEVDAIINIAKLKVDEELGLLGACSNIFGLVPGSIQDLVKNRMETLGDFNDYLIDMLECFSDKLILNIVDAVVALEGGKTQRMLNCLAMSECPYCVDAVMCDILGVKYEHTILKQAKDRDLFNVDKPYRLVGQKVEKFKVDDFVLVDFDTRKILPYSASYYKSHQQRPTIDKNVCKGCKICSKECPTNAIIMRYDNRGELYAEIDYKKCIHCNKCITACPYSVVKQLTPTAYKKLQKELNKYNKEKNN